MTHFSPPTKDAFYYARPSGQGPVELTKGKWNDLFIKPNPSVPFTFRPEFRLLYSEVGLKTIIFVNEKACFDRTTLQEEPFSCLLDFGVLD